MPPRRTQKQQEEQQNAAALLDKVPPHDLEAERSVLGSILLLNDAIDDVQPLLPSPDRFYADAHRRMYGAILKMRSGKRPRAADAVTLAAELDKTGDLAEIEGGPAYLLQVLETVPHAAHAAYYARIVRDKWLQRQTIEACTHGLRKAFAGGSDDFNDVVSEIERSIFKIREGFSDDAVVSSGADIIRETMERIFRRMDGVERGMSTGYPALDNLTGGFHDREVIVLGARTSMGKTSLLCNFAIHAMAEEKAPTLIFSVEQGKMDLAERMLAIRAGINLKRLRTGQIDENDQNNLAKALDEMKEGWPLFIDDQHKKVSEIAAVARRYKRKHGIRFIVIDYLQKMEPEDRKVQREQQISEMSRTIGYLAADLNVPILLLAQIGRDVEKDKREPRLSDLRESAAIEQDADQVIFIHRPEAFDPEDSPGEAHIIVAKNRSGEIGRVKLRWIKETLTFASMPDDGFDNMYHALPI